MSLGLAFRDAVDADQGLVLDSWLASFRNAHAAGLIAMADWRAVMGPQIVKLLRRPGVRVVVAYVPSEPPGADAVGWVAVESRARQPPLVLYVYVRHPYRRLGLARRLLERAGVTVDREWHYACKTGVVTKLQPKLGRGKWTPLAARYPHPDEECHGASAQP